MGLENLTAAFFIAGTIATGALSILLANELKAWRPKIVQGLLRAAVRQLPKSQQDRYAEEWASYLAETPGDIAKVVEAFGFLFMSWKRSRQRNPFGVSGVLFWSMARDKQWLVDASFILFELDYGGQSQEVIEQAKRYAKSCITSRDVLRMRFRLHCALIFGRLAVAKAMGASIGQSAFKIKKGFRLQTGIDLFAAPGKNKAQEAEVVGR